MKDFPIRASNIFIHLACLTLSFCTTDSRNQNGKPIDRFALVSRHKVVLNNPDTLGSLSVGNGEFAFTVDISGLQTFPQAYENGISLGTMAQWGWHSIPQTDHYSLKDVSVPYESCDGMAAPYAVQKKDGRAGKATEVLRANPHRLHLGLIGLVLRKENGEEVKLEDLSNIDQQLDLWNGRIESSYQIEGLPVHVLVYCHQEEDRIGVKIESPLIEKGRLWIKFDFPYGKDCHVCPGYDWDKPEKHQSKIISKTSQSALLKRTLDTTQYFVQVDWNKGKMTSANSPHHFELKPENEKEFDFTVQFKEDSLVTFSDFEKVESNSTLAWEKFWSTGGVVDFSECTDPRARELERRVVLSQYLTKIQCSGSLPPQETGLTMNSWYGKFHLEMHWWHAAHFALWNRALLLEKSMGWYGHVLPKAVATAQGQNYLGARWQKMTDPFGNESPSSVGAFIIWQQPHPIYLAELLYRNDPTKSTLLKYQDMVFNTADFMASFVRLRGDQYHLCHPLIPAQEIFKATETDDPAFELQYWFYGLTTAQQWRVRLGMKPNEDWNEVITKLTLLTVKNSLYLPNATTSSAYEDDQYRRDHPAVVAAFGILPLNERIDTIIMRNTLENIMKNWKWETTWGWDYPMLAMTAARLNKPSMAIDALLMNVQKNTYLINGHNYQDKRLRLYLPGNGGLLTAVGMMAAGWDGNQMDTPGFPKDGKWKVRWEGIRKMQ